jgi:hypothetical protein
MAPSLCQEPELRQRDRSDSGRPDCRWRPPPSVEPSSRRGNVQTNGRVCSRPLAPMLARVQEHVRERISHFARRAQRSHVVPVQVIALDRELTHAEVFALGRLTQTRVELRDEPLAAQRRYPAPDPQRHVRWAARRNRTTLHVMNERSGRSRLATCARATTTVTSELQLQLSQRPGSRSHSILILAMLVRIVKGDATQFAIQIDLHGGAFRVICNGIRRCAGRARGAHRRGEWNCRGLAPRVGASAGSGLQARR